MCVPIAYAHNHSINAHAGARGLKVRLSLQLHPKYFVYASICADSPKPSLLDVS